MTPRSIKLALISSSLAQDQITAWQTRLGNTTLSNFDSSRIETLRLAIELNPLGLRQLSLCRDGRFYLVLEQAGAVIRIPLNHFIHPCEFVRSAAPQAREVLVSAARTESVFVPTPSRAG